MPQTITELLAEIPTITKRIEKKQAFISSYLYRPSANRDPHEKDGGSATLIEQELQSISDLQSRIVAIRAAIQKANSEHTITVGNSTRPIADWLTWRREVAPVQQRFMATMVDSLNRLRRDAQMKGMSVTDKDSGGTQEIVVNINEKNLAIQIEDMENVLGTLDGQLSLKNATIMIDL